MIQVDTLQLTKSGLDFREKCEEKCVKKYFSVVLCGLFDALVFDLVFVYSCAMYLMSIWETKC